jgi:hypothetical protein
MRMRSVSGQGDGFTLVEAIMASFVVVILFAGFGRTMGAAFKGSVTNAHTQEATAIAVEQLEFARSLEWQFVAMSSVDESAPMVNGETGRLSAEPNHLESEEEFFVDEDGLIVPYNTETVDGTSYTIWSYVTHVDDGLRRLVYLIQWEVEGDVSTYQTATLISEVSTRSPPE